MMVDTTQEPPDFWIGFEAASPTFPRAVFVCDVPEKDGWEAQNYEGRLAGGRTPNVRPLPFFRGHGRAVCQNIFCR